MTVGRIRDEPPIAADVERAPRWARDRSPDDRRARSAGVQLLVVDPDDGCRDAVVAHLRAEGVGVTWCASAVDGLIEFGRLDPDVVIVTPLLSEVPAAEFVAAVRRQDSRLLLVGLDAEAAGSAGPLFLAGATAAVTRPYDPDEVMDRIVAHTPDLDTRARVTFGDIVLDPRAYEVRLGGEPLDGLPLKEFELLHVLMVHGNAVVATETIRRALWGNAEQSPSSNAIAVHAARLRTRLGDHARLTRVRGRGYRLSGS